MNNSMLEECTAYFKREQGFDRCFRKMRKKWKSYGKAAGRIRLEAATADEKRTIGGFLGRTYWETHMVFPFSDFEKALGETRFREIPMVSLLECYFGEKLVTNQGEKALEERRKEEFWSRIVRWLEDRQGQREEKKLQEEKRLREERKLQEGREREEEERPQEGQEQEEEKKLQEGRKQEEGEKPQEGRKREEGERPQEGRKREEEERTQEGQEREEEERTQEGQEQEEEKKLQEGQEREEEEKPQEEQKTEGIKGALAWIRGMAEEKQYGYSTVMGLWKNDENGAEAMVRNVCQGYFVAMETKEEGIPLAVLAARVTGNPHYFDRGQNAAVLLLHVLCHAGGREVPRDIAGIHEVYGDGGIVADEIASTVAFYRLHMRRQGGEENRILEAFCAAGEPGILSLANLAGAEAAWGEGNCVYVVENEMVFSYLVKCCREMPVTLLCTSGQLSCAAQRLLCLLCEGGARIRYSGDMDPEGIGIADHLWRKYPHNIRIWRMDGQDYLDALSEEQIEEWRLRKLQGLEHPLLRTTAEHVRQVGRAAYQENILERLAEDIMLWTSKNDGSNSAF